MTASPSSNGALTAFLRGVERRGLVFAELQSGDPAKAEASLATTLEAFTRLAGRSPFAEWPRRFWSMLLAAPDLRGANAPQLRDGPLAVLAGVGSGPRAALLLRLVAGLPEADAAAVLGISPSTYRLALQRALPRMVDGGLDPELWRAMAEASQQAIRALPEDRLRRLAGMPGTAGTARPVVRDEGSRRRWLWPATWGVVLLTALALAATWWWPGPASETEDGGPRIRSDALQPTGEPGGRYDEGFALLTHRDLDLLLDAGGSEAVSDDPAFDAWLVSTLPQEVGDATP